jgi:predicted nucleic acid-binding Zn ribbon protein
MNPSYDDLDFDQANDLTRQRQRFKRRPQRPANILSQLMARKGYGQHKTNNEIDEVWNAVVGEKWQSKTRVGNISRGVLEVFVSSPAVNQRLGFQKKKLLAELTKRLPQNKIKDIKFSLGSIEPR